MLRTMLLVSVAAVLAVTIAAWAAPQTTDTVVSITGTVDPFVEWENATYTIVPGDFSGSVSGTTINKVGEYLTLTAPKAMTLWANHDCSIHAVGTANSGIATEPNNSDHLTTSYMITGDVGNADEDYKLASAGAGGFFNAGNTYSVTHVPNDGAYTINLGVKLESAVDRAQDAGDYACSITLTASW